MKKKRSFLVLSCDQEVTRAEAAPLCGISFYTSDTGEDPSDNAVMSVYTGGLLLVPTYISSPCTRQARC